MMGPGSSGLFEPKSMWAAGGFYTVRVGIEHLCQRESIPSFGFQKV